MLDDRKAAILRAVVEEYIDTAQPVGSGHVARAAGVDGVVGDGPQRDGGPRARGLPAQPHTAPGGSRPRRATGSSSTHLDAPAPLGALDSASRCESFFARAHGELEQMLHETTPPARPTSTALRRGRRRPAHDRGHGPLGAARRPRRPRSALLVVVLSNGAVEKRTLELGEPTSSDERRRRGRGPPRRRTSSVGRSAPPAPPCRHRATPSTDRLVRAGAAPPSAADAERRRRPGLRRWRRPDGDAFDAVETVRQVLELLEQQYVVVSAAPRRARPRATVAIGTETGLEPLAECSVVVAPTRSTASRPAPSASSGPTRMNYPQALAAVAVVSQRLGQPSDARAER